VIDEYKKVTKPLGCKLMHVMLLALGLSEEQISHSMIGDSSKISNLVHLNSYPACPDPDRALGLVPHTDTGFITIVHHNGVSGLQVFRRKDGFGPARWVPVPVVPDTFVVNLGDLMHIVSNARFHNVLHRATVGRTYRRLSVATFFAPPLDVQVGPLSELTGPKQGPIYKPMTWLEFLKLRDVLYDKTLQSIKISGN
jgi:gibberellin 3beta-dioxygenase